MGAPSVLVSLHDVSPLTLVESREALALVQAAGWRADELTVLVIPWHEGRAALDEDPATARWLRGLADAGATLLLHGLTHRMAERLGPVSWFWGWGFARGQGELYRADAAAAERCLARGHEILARAGLGDAIAGFVPPAWLLSAAARAAVEGAGFPFYEIMSGIVWRGQLRARRLVGWGSLNAIESTATALFAAAQARRAPADTRVAVHPADMRRARSRASVTRTLALLRERLRPASYARFLGEPPALAAARG